ncbi:MAG: sulfatase-like hydrolase/transferase, partial [Actinomycetota bacterium]
DTLIALTADHGIAFQAGDFARRATAAQAGDAMWVPFFLRAPQLPEGAVDDRNVEMVDLTPTIADLLDVPIGWEVDGRSTLGPPRTDTTKSFSHNPGKPVLIDGATWLPRVLGGAVDQLLAPGEGQDRLYRLRPNGDLVGMPVTSFSVIDGTGATAAIEQAGAITKLDEGADHLPALVTGRLLRRGDGGDASVAFVLNGTVAGVSEVYGDGRVAAMLDEAAFREGENRFEVFLLRRLRTGATLEPVDLR